MTARSSLRGERWPLSSAVGRSPKISWTKRVRPAALRYSPPLMSRRVPFALGSFVLSAILTAIGSFRGDDDHAWRQWLIVLAIAAVATAIVFWVIVPRIGNPDRGALILAIVGAVTIIVFWTGVPVVIAGGATLLALDARERAATRLSTAALVTAALTVIAAIVLAVFG
jgi:hypothetical protein